MIVGLIVLIFIKGAEVRQIVLPVIVLPKRGGEVEGNNLVIKLSCQKGAEVKGRRYCFDTKSDNF